MTTATNSDTWAHIHQIFEESIPFHKWLNFKIIDLETKAPKLVIDRREEFIGNFVRGTLHGGIISTVLDVIGGIVAFTEVTTQKQILTKEEKLKQFAHTGTIDLRVDYLRPGVGEQFIASGFVLRAGNKVAVTRMELHNDKNLLIAVGTGAYVVA